MGALGVVAVVIVIGVAYLAFGAENASASGLGSTLGGLLSGGKLSSDQIQQYAQNAGFGGNDLATATAIALAESSGDPNALGDPTLGVSVGLWQINLKAHPEYTQQELLDPQTNANAAYAVYSSAGGFHPWTTYNTGAYQEYLA